MGIAFSHRISLQIYPAPLPFSSQEHPGFSHRHKKFKIERDPLTKNSTPQNKSTCPPRVNGGHGSKGPQGCSRAAFDKGLARFGGSWERSKEKKWKCAGPSPAKKRARKLVGKRYCCVVSERPIHVTFPICMVLHPSPPFATVARAQRGYTSSKPVSSDFDRRVSSSARTRGSKHHACGAPYFSVHVCVRGCHPQTQ